MEQFSLGILFGTIVLMTVITSFLQHYGPDRGSSEEAVVDLLQAIAAKGELSQKEIEAIGRAGEVAFVVRRSFVTGVRGVGPYRLTSRGREIAGRGYLKLRKYGDDPS